MYSNNTDLTLLQLMILNLFVFCWSFLTWKSEVRAPHQDVWTLNTFLLFSYLSCHPASSLDIPCSLTVSVSSTRAAGCVTRPTEESQLLNPCDQSSLCLDNAGATQANPLLADCGRWADLCRLSSAGLETGTIVDLENKLQVVSNRL